MIKVIFDIMRHGEKEGDSLTPKGVQQVRDSALKNLVGCVYTLAFYSGFSRARQTVETCQRELGQAVVPNIEEGGFSYEPAMTEAEKWMGRPFSELKKEGYEGKNVEWWLRNWAPAIYIRGQIIATMRILVETIAGTHILSKPISVDNRTFRVLVGSHGPAAESGCLDPANTPALREADIIRYTWSVDPTEATPPTLLESVVLRAPY